jgi:spermidine synthase
MPGCCRSPAGRRNMTSSIAVQSVSNSKPQTASVHQPHGIPSFLLYIISFTSGFVVLSLEILGFRLFAPYFGYSVFVSGSLISLILIALSLGYYIGGKTADRHPGLRPVFFQVLVSSMYITATIFLYHPVLSFFSNFPPVMGTISAATVIFGPPMVLLSMISPFLVKVRTSQKGEKSVGTTVGTLSAVSTFGCIAGSLTTTFLLIPAWGSRATLVICILLLTVPAACCITALSTRRQLLLVLPAPLACMIASSVVRQQDPSVVFSRESVYNLVKVLKTGGFYRLKLNREDDTQSLFTTDHRGGSVYLKNRYDTHMMAALPMSGGTDVLILGMGGGTSANQLALQYGKQVRIEAVEIDRVVNEAAERFFAIKTINPALTVHIEDARTFVNSVGKRFDVVQMDMYHGGIYMPFYIATREFFMKVNACLSDSGIMVMNVLADTKGGGDDLYKAIGNTLHGVFGSVYLFSIPDIVSNVLFFCTRQETSMQLLKTRAAAFMSAYPGTGDISPILTVTFNKLTPYTPDRTFPVLTDDHAPIERLTWKVFRKLERTLELQRKQDIGS